MGVATAIIGSAFISGFSSFYQEEQTKKAIDDANEKAEAERLKAEKEADRISMETRPEGETMEGISFGSGNGDVGSTSDFLVEKQQSVSALGTSTSSSGLGFSV